MLQLIHKDEELKYFDASLAYSQVDRAGTVTKASAINQNVGVSDRVGDKLTMKYMEFRLNAYLNGVLITSDVEHKFRVVVFRWKIDDSGGAPVAGSVLQQAGANLITVSPYAFTSQRQRDFEVLFDATYGCTRAIGANVSERINLFNKSIEFNAAVNTGMGHIYVLVCADDVTGAHVPSISAQWYSRIHFVDA